MKMPRLVVLLSGFLASVIPTPAAVDIASPTSAPTTGTPTTAAAPASSPLAKGKIQAFIVQGDVQLVDASDSTKAAPLKRGQTFEEGNIIKVGPGAQALLVFSNGATMKALQNCELSVDKFQQAKFNEAAEGTFLRLSKDPSRSITVLNLRKGTLQGEFKRPNKDAGSTFVINTAKGPINFDKGGSISISSTGEIIHVDGAMKPTPAATTAQVALTVDPKTGAITGGSVTGNASPATTQALAKQVMETINQARADNSAKQN